MTLWLHRIESPLGPIQVAFTEGGALTYLGFADHEPREALMKRLQGRSRNFSTENAPLSALIRQMEAYFTGHRHRFTVPLALEGTPFQLRVWAELLKIPYGQTLSYGELARRLGDPKLCRAVGAANGANPVSILVPCHRVIGGNGALQGYAGGLHLKARLLELELNGA